MSTVSVCIKEPFRAGLFTCYPPSARECHLCTGRVDTFHATCLIYSFLEEYFRHVPTFMKHADALFKGLLGLGIECLRTISLSFLSCNERISVHTESSIFLVLLAHFRHSFKEENVVPLQGPTSETPLRSFLLQCCLNTSNISRTTSSLLTSS